MAKKDDFRSLDLLSAYSEKKDPEKIRLSEIRFNPEQPRVFGRENVSDLTSSMKRLGLIEPVVLRREKGQYIIVAGERRCRAALELKWTSIQAIITDATPDMCYEMALAENEKRKSLNPWEVGKAIQHLRKERKKSASEVGELLGYSERYIKQLSSIARLDQKSVLNLIKGGAEPTVKNLEALLKKKEGRGETISPPRGSKISLNISSLTERQKESFMKDLHNLKKKYRLA